MTFLPDEKKFCHRTGFEKKCRDLVVSEKCWLWVGVVGTNPNTGETVNEHGCADAWQHMLLVQIAAAQHQSAASQDKAANEARGFRNDMRAVNGLPGVLTHEFGALALPKG